jgi:hypothetical protein
MITRSALIRFVLLWLVAGTVPVHAQAPGGLLASPAIDYQAFRDGEVTRTQTVFGRWTAVCDEIKRFHQRFCSLRSRAFDPLNRPIADIVISTADDGHPAALITVGLGMIVGEPLVLEPVPAEAPKLKGKGRAPKPPLPTRLAARLCDANGCQMFWSLTGNDIGALREGRDIRLSFLGAYVPGIYPYPPTLKLNAVVLQGAFQGAGFSDAIAASLK